MKLKNPTQVILRKRLIHPKMKHEITLHRDQKEIENQKLCLLVAG